MWPMVREVVQESSVVGLGAIAEAIRLLLVDCHLVAEGAGAAPLASALADPDLRPAACVISGAGIDIARLVEIISDP
jgi:threonine dehydratase